MTDTAQLLTVADVGRVLGVTPGRVRQMDNDGILRATLRTPARQSIAGYRLYDAADVAAYAAKREARAKAKVKAAAMVAAVSS